MNEDTIKETNRQKCQLQIAKIISDHPAYTPYVTIFSRDLTSMYLDEKNFKHLGYHMEFCIRNEEKWQGFEPPIVILRYLDEFLFQNIMFVMIPREDVDVYYLSEKGDLTDFKALFKFFDDCNCLLSFNKKDR